MYAFTFGNIRRQDGIVVSTTSSNVAELSCAQCYAPVPCFLPCTFFASCSFASRIVVRSMMCSIRKGIGFRGVNAVVYFVARRLSIRLDALQLP